MTDAITTDTVDAGDHACLTFTDHEERLDLVGAFVRDGLRADVKVICWTDVVSTDELAGQLAARSVRAGAALRRGQLRIVPVSPPPGAATINAAAMVKVLADEVEAVGREGYRGLRVTADMGWATRWPAADELIAFETEVASLFGSGRLCLICQYDRDRFDAVTLAFAAKAHPRTLAAQVYLEHPLLRICRQYSPPGIRVAGQLDYRHRDVLEQALSESLRLDRHPYLNLAGLDYIDGACAGLVVAAAVRLSGSRRMTVICRRAVATVFALAGASAAGRLRVQSADEQP